MKRLLLLAALLLPFLASAATVRVRDLPIATNVSETNLVMIVTGSTNALATPAAVARAAGALTNVNWASLTSGENVFGADVSGALTLTNTDEGAWWIFRETGNFELSGSINAAGFTGDGGSLSNLDASALSIGTVPLERIDYAATNITGAFRTLLSLAGGSGGAQPATLKIGSSGPQVSLDSQFSTYGRFVVGAFATGSNLWATTTTSNIVGSFGIEDGAFYFRNGKFVTNPVALTNVFSVTAAGRVTAAEYVATVGGVTIPVLSSPPTIAGNNGVLWLSNAAANPVLYITTTNGTFAH